MVHFDVRDGRVMVSLGPLSAKKYCSFSCPFCYVQSDDYGSYPSLDIAQILDWVRQVPDSFDIIYVSGDTDSLAPPRTEKGLELLSALCEFEVDILFTTRAVIPDDLLWRLQNIQNRLNQKGNLLFGCVSIAQLCQPYIEPAPIPTPQERLRQLKQFKEMGLVAVLAVRPFLPVISTSEYIEIVSLARENVDIILGSAWYTDEEGNIERKVFGEKPPDNVMFSRMRIDFHESNATWKTFLGREIEIQIEQICTDLRIPFFMRSAPAIDWARNRKKPSYKHVVFDLDGTLYPRSAGVDQIIDENIVRYIQKSLGLDYASATELSEKYQQSHGLAVLGFRDDYGIDPDIFLKEAHNIDYESAFLLNPELDALLRAVHLPKCIFSNAPSYHVSKVLNRLGVAGHFDVIVDLDTLNLNPKPCQKSYSVLLDTLSSAPDGVIFIDDRVDNLIPAHDMGMTTVWVAPQASRISGVDHAASEIKDAVRLIIELIKFCQ